MTYATITHLKSRYNERTLRQITDETAQSINEDAAQTAIDDASEEIDSFLGQRYTLPLASTNGDPSPNDHPVLARIACDIAVYRLQVLRPADDIKDARQRYADAIKVLEKMAKGELCLLGRALRDDIAPAADTATAGMPMFGQPPSLFGRSSR